MSLAPGGRLDHYEIVERIGVGGMGEVFRARDTRLPREVAIKVSSQAFNERFAREAKVIASLNHPNICTLFDVGPDYLVMELVEGVTLQDRIKQGVMNLEEASRIARQIADALDYAHEHGVIHRDLKPANIKVRPDGVVKVLDFGLAKAVQAVNADDVATVTLDATQAGAILGTPNYMSPEQATGRPTDKRSDTWAFGIVFYEMLAGGKPFGGATVQESIASTLRDAPDLTKVPSQARRLLRKCLEKDPQNRLKHLGDVMSLLDEPASVELPPGSVKVAPARPNWLWPALAAAGLVAAAVLALLHFTEKAPPRQVVHFDFGVPPEIALSRTGSFALSPDGRSIVFAAGRRQERETKWWLRRLDSNEVRPLNLQTTTDPFPPVWSPDSRYILYQNVDRLVKADVSGGEPITICEKCAAIGASWNSDGTILIGSLSSIARVSENGGTPVDVATVDRLAGMAALHPVLLPDGKHFLYFVALNNTGNTGIRVGSLDLKPGQQSQDWLLETSSQVAWVPPVAGSPGQLLYMNGTTLVARAFDPDKLTFIGEPATVVNEIGYWQNWAWAMFSVAPDGQLVYRHRAQTNLQRLTWFDRTGKSLGTVGDPGQFNVVTLSPDAKRAAVAAAGDAGSDIWVADLEAGTKTRLTSEPGTDSQPVWSPDGASIAYTSQRDKRSSIVRRASNGAPGETIIHQFPEGAGGANLSDWSPDGKLLLYHQGAQASGTNIWMLDATAANSDPKPLLQTQFQEIAARVSPDGRWYIYRNNESGRQEIYVQAMPGYGAPPGKFLVSRDGGIGMARWRRDGKEVAFLSLDGAVMAADVKLLPSFQSGPPHKLFDLPAAFKNLFVTGQPGALADMSSDAQRFLFAVPAADSSTIPFQVTTDWRAALAK